jgi:succinate-acetate transporter protein
MGLLVFMYLICSLRTNIVFFGIFVFLDIALFLLTGAYWKAAEGDAVTYQRLTVVRPSFFDLGAY